MLRIVALCALLPGTAWGQDWSIDQRTNLMTDDAITVVSRIGFTQSPCYNKQPVIYFSCEGDELRAVVIHQCYAPDILPGGRVEVRYGTNQMSFENFAISTDDSALIKTTSERSAAMIRRLLDVDVFHVSVTPYRSAEKIFSFDMTGLADALAQSEMSCALDD